MNSLKKIWFSTSCDSLLLNIPPQSVGMFRFLLEARDNLAMFTVLDRKLALLKLLFAPEDRMAVLRALEEIKKDLPLEWREWPKCGNAADFADGVINEIWAREKQA